VSGFEQQLQAWDGEETVIRYDEASGTWMFVCIDSTVLGPAGGGTRMFVYASPSDGLADAMRLSRAMTLKMAVAGAGFGGGKAVLAVPALPEGEARRALLLRYGALVTSLGGTYRTAADLNTSSADLDVIGEVCPYVYGRSEAKGGSGDSGRGTARGVFHGIRASLHHVYGTDKPAGRSVLVQGLGSVGARLAAELVAAGAHLLVSDVEASRAAALAGELGARAVPAAEVLETPCDVLSPCAVGGVLNAESIPRLRCRIVAGAANNQLATPEDADRFEAAGILYAPDFVVNAGGILQLLGLEDLGWDEATLEEHLARIGESLTEIFIRAEREGVSTAAAAEHVAYERIAAGRS
jgi:glutamate dehydrogenase/leucine dehydrogenase